jgi:hypothetical protein
LPLSFRNLRKRRIARVRRKTMRTNTSVDTIEIMDVKLVMVET